MLSETIELIKIRDFIRVPYFFPQIILLVGENHIPFLNN
jgi:hypothetical protein